MKPETVLTDYKDDIERSYLLDEFKLLADVMDIIIITRTKENMLVLKRWEDWFTYKKVPWVTVKRVDTKWQRRTHYILWKERIIDDGMGKRSLK